ncbi:TolC family protein [Chryseobacterium salipaludis]|uniref:TolC family protein n=1 Tax=Chryseobacterium TaxID=59732 RepID=UPI001FF44A3F|nr:MULTISPECIES: TolC family protein [Chryseobacterium]MCJ8496697.1 TolC family protein [Chryseobacterium salipaludis]MCX3296178.1 TolC family protein [Planobacterium sp. JC490]
MKTSVKTLFLAGALSLPMASWAQERELTASEVISYALENHPQLAVSQKKMEVSRQNTEVAKLQKLPTLTASTSQFYLGNSLIIDKDFSNSMSVALPHYGSTYAVQASQLIFKGGAVNKSIEITELQQQLAQLDYEKDQQDVKFLVLSNYLDIYKTMNQNEVYLNNKKLAQERLRNTMKFYEQGMITRNEVIRSELAIKNIDQGLIVLANNRKILNYNLNQALGFADDIQIIPVEPVHAALELRDLAYYQQLAHSSNPREKSLRTSVAVAEKNIEIIKTEQMPTIGAFGGYSLNRPMTSTQPVLDMYSGGFQVGVSVNYNIDNLFKTKEKIQLGTLQKEQTEETYRLAAQGIDMEVNAAYTRYQNAQQNLILVEEAKELANENYKIIEAKYLNQLAVQAEMTDAQNQKIQAELDYANAEIEAMYQYYNLLKTTGTL